MFFADVAYFFYKFQGKVELSMLCLCQTPPREKRGTNRNHQTENNVKAEHPN